MVSMSVLRLVVWQLMQDDDYLLDGEYIWVEESISSLGPPLLSTMFLYFSCFRESLLLTFPTHHYWLLAAVCQLAACGFSCHGNPQWC